MKAFPLPALAATLTAGLSACSVFDPDTTVAWEEPLPSAPGASGDGDAPVTAALFAHPKDEEAANLLALERAPVPVLQIRKPLLPSPIITDFASVPEEEEPAAISEIPLPEPPRVKRAILAEIEAPEPPPIEAEIIQPPVIVAGSGVPDPGSVLESEPLGDPEVAEIQTEILLSAEGDLPETTTLTLDPIIDSPPSADYSVKLPEEPVTTRTE